MHVSWFRKDLYLGTQTTLVAWKNLYGFPWFVWGIKPISTSVTHSFLRKLADQKDTYIRPPARVVQNHVKGDGTP